MSGPRATIFLDFDGTITIDDATDAILTAFADPAWLEIEREWLTGRIGSRACLAAQMALVNASGGEIDALLDTIGVDAGVATLLDTCAARGSRVYVVSDGFDYCIQRILGRPNVNLRARLPASHVMSSHLRLHAGRWTATFPHPVEPCAHGCATCKPMAMARLHVADAVSVFVGDGMSDRHAASCADVVFAKDSLAAFCDRASIAYVPFESLADVAQALEHVVRNGPATERSMTGKVLPLS